MFYRIEVPTYFNTRLNMRCEANSFLVNGTAAKDKHVAQIGNQGCTEFNVVELTAAEYRNAAMAKIRS